MSAFRSSLRTAVMASTTLALVAVTSPAYAITREIGPSDGASGDHFGTSVAMDGDTLVVGAPGKASAQGAVYVYTRTAGETWTQSAKLTASDGVAGDGLGGSVAIDGDTIVAGAVGDDSGAGSVYLFSRTGAAMRTQLERLDASDRANGDAFGTAVDIDGDTIVVGAPADDLPGENAAADHGSVYTFATVGVAGRDQTAKLTASDNTISGFAFAGSQVGASVAIDGDTIVAGAPLDLFGDPSGPRHGSVYTFARTGASTRQETAKLTVTGQTTGRVGESVDIEGDTIVAGDSEADDAFGAAWLFSRTGAVARNQSGELTLTNPSQNKQFGTSVSMSSTYIVVGATSYSTRGSAFVFTRTGAANRTNTWFTSGTALFAESYGASVVTDGDRVIGGAPHRDMVSPTRDEQGLVYSSTPDLSVTKLGNGTGSISSSSGGIANCTSSCTGNYLLGDVVTLTATPSAGSYFAGWENYTPCQGSTATTCVVTMDREPQVVARFTVGSPPGDTTPPTVTIGSGPANGSTVTTASVTFGFSSNETSTFQCAYDGAAFASCTSPGPGLTGSDIRTSLSEAGHTFKVRATDTAGNLSTEQTRSFTVDLPAPPGDTTPPGDTSPPQTTITDGPPKTVKTTKQKARVTVAFRASEEATFLCQVDDKVAKACTSPATFKLRLGKHTILVIAVDSAGNRDASPAKIKVKVKKK